MHKVWIGTIRGLSCTNLGSEFCTDNSRIVEVLAHAQLPVCHMYASWNDGASRGSRAADENSLPIHKEGREQIVNMRVGLHQIYVQKHKIY